MNGLDSTRARWWLAASLAFVLILSLPNLTYPLGNDQATYALIGEGLLRGEKLYRDLWDMKPPGIFWTYAVILKLFGRVMWSVGLVDILWLVAISCCIYRFAARYLGIAGAVTAVVVHAWWHERGGPFYSAQPENFFTLLILAAYLLQGSEGRRRSCRALAAGLLVGGAFWLKYNALAFLPFVAIAPWLDFAALDARPRRFRITIPWREWYVSTASLLAGAAAVAAVGFASFWRAGLWTTFWTDHFAVASRYARAVLKVPGYWKLPPSSAILHIGLLTLAATVVAFVMASSRREWAALAPAGLGLAFGYATVAAQLHFPPFAYEACYPFLAMFWGYLVAKGLSRWQVFHGRLGTRGERRALWALTATVGVILLGVVVRVVPQNYRELSAWSRDQDRFYANYPVDIPFEFFRDKWKTVQYLRQHGQPGDGLYVWGLPCLLYYLTGMRNPSRFEVNYPLISAWGPPEWRDELVRDLEASPPTFIVVARKDQAVLLTSTPMDSDHYLEVFPTLNSFISASYRKVADFSEFVVYRRTTLVNSDSMTWPKHWAVRFSLDV